MGEAVTLKVYPGVNPEKWVGNQRMVIIYVRVSVGVLSHKSLGHTKLNLNLDFVHDAKLSIYTLAHGLTKN